MALHYCEDASDGFEAEEGFQPFNAEDTRRQEHKDADCLASDMPARQIVITGPFEHTRAHFYVSADRSGAMPDAYRTFSTLSLYSGCASTQCYLTADDCDQLAAALNHAATALRSRSGVRS